MTENDRTAPVEYRTIPRLLGFRFGDDASVQTCWTLGVKPRVGGEWRDIKPQPRPNGHLWAYLGPRGVRPSRLDETICEAFHGVRPPGAECLHRDGERGNCLPSNLCWGIAPENVRDPAAEYRSILPEAEGYEFGSDGSAWSAWGTGSRRPGDVWRRMSPTVLESGHLQIAIKWDGKSRRFGVHHLICIAFHGPCPEGMECRHYPDPDPTNNRPENLRWGTSKQNSGDAIEHGTLRRGESHGGAKLTEADVAEARRSYAAGQGAPTIAKRLGISATAVLKMLSGQAWSHVPGAVAIRDGDSYRKLTDEIVIESRRLYGAGVESAYSLARRHGVALPTMLRALRGEVWCHLPGAVTASPGRREHLQAEDELREIRRLFVQERMTIKDLAERFNLSRPTIQKIVNDRRTWRDT